MAMPDLYALANRSLDAALATPSGTIALVAAGVAGLLVVVSSFVKTMIPLRYLAVAGNVGFLVYGALHPAFIMILLHGALLPINLWRLAEMVRLTRRVATALEQSDLSGVWLRPYMRKQRLRAGQVLFRKGDPATHLYFLAEGQIELVEIGQLMQPGLFGEIAFFAPDKRRTLTARCATRCTVLRIDEDTFKQLYLQNPAFGFQVVSLMAGRLLDDRRRLEAQVQASRPADLAPAGGTG
jgi:CRP/FNR family transcriptional regulator, cyclic AMP receptor protein